MSRHLFVVPPLIGHIGPAVGVAAALRERGDEVAWVGSAELIRRVAGPVGCYPVTGPLTRNGAANRPTGLRGFAALRFLWENFLVPLADEMAETVQDAVADFRPDVIFADQQALAGALVATRAGIPWVTSATTTSELTDSLAAMPKVAAWIGELQAGLKRRHGVDGGGDLRFSPELVVVFSSVEFSGMSEEGPLRFVGPVVDGRMPSIDPRWSTYDITRPLVVVTLGTASAEIADRFLGEAVRAMVALGDEVQPIVVRPGGGSADGVDVVESAPLLQLLEKASVVVCHAGHNTVCESLSYGVPLVVAPIRDDQPIIARQVVDAGAGIRLRFGRSTANDVMAAVREVLGVEKYRLNADRIRQSFAKAGGAERAAAEIATLTRAR